MKRQLLKNCMKAMLILICMSLCSLSLYAQSRKITGTVLDEKNAPLIGATVKLKSGRLTTSTDANGKFSINVPNNETALLITYIGYIDQEVAVNAQSANLEIRLAQSSRS